MVNLYCPECGKQSLRVIETKGAEYSDEYKLICTCESCDNMIHVFRELDATEVADEVCEEARQRNEPVN